MTGVNTSKRPIARRMSLKMIRTLSQQQLQLEAEIRNAAALGQTADQAVSAHAANEALLDASW